VYHLFYADEEGAPGSDITFFEYRNARPGKAGAGMVHTVEWRLASEDSLDFWEQRLARENVVTDRGDGSLGFADPEGLRHRLSVVETGDEPLVAVHPEIPRELALQGFDGVRAYAADPEQSRRFLEGALDFDPRGEDAWEVRGGQRGGFYAYDRTGERGIGGAGTVHHVAWASPIDDHEAWWTRVAEAGASPTPIIDRYYFRSIYFREPSGVLFEIATIGPGFTADEPLEHLGERLSLPPDYEQLRDRLEHVLTPLPDPRPARVGG
jgi:glyoxalase family protein